jgi:hypothetical protein
MYRHRWYPHRGYRGCEYRTAAVRDSTLFGDIDTRRQRRLGEEE